MNRTAAKSTAAVILIVGTAILSEIWMATSGTFRVFNGYTRFNTQLSDSFLHHRLSLAIQPAPALLALPDPYDPAANHDLRVIDLSLYKGKYYLYWGPVPAAVQAIVWRILGLDFPNALDAYLGFGFACAMTLAAALLIFQIQAKLFNRQSIGGAGYATLSMAMSAPVMYCLSATSIYETAIFAGQFFLLAGMCAAWFAFRDGGAKPLLLMAAGACWAMAIGSRVSLPPAVAVLTLLALLQIRRAQPSSPKYRAAGSLLVSMLVGALILGWYNYARFGSVTETGSSYQLASAPQNSLLATGFMSFGHILPNIAGYLLTVPQKKITFPYFVVVEAKTWLSRYFRLSPGFAPDPIAGLLWTQPFLVFAFFARSRTKSSESAPDFRRRHLLSWTVRSLFFAGVLGFLPSLMMQGVTMRYLVDGIPCFSLLAAIGYWQTLESFSARPRWASEVRMFVRVIVPLQCALGILLGVSRNLALFHTVSRWFPIW